VTCRAIISRPIISALVADIRALTSLRVKPRAGNLGDRRCGMTMFADDLADTGKVVASRKRAADVPWLAQNIRDYDRPVT
jgi:hypothetical protein